MKKFVNEKIKFVNKNEEIKINKMTIVIEIEEKNIIIKKREVFFKKYNVRIFLNKIL
jgi:hypothetical protein